MNISMLTMLSLRRWLRDQSTAHGSKRDLKIFWDILVGVRGPEEDAGGRRVGSERQSAEGVHDKVHP
jgi:hypothetical protein